MPLYHYTLPPHLPSILAEGIHPATAFVPEKERPVVWLTTSEDFEPTALKGVLTEEGERRHAQGLPFRPLEDSRRLTFEEQLREVGAARVEVREEAAPLTWWSWLKASGVRRRDARGLHQVANEEGSDVNLWRASFKVIPAQTDARHGRLARGRVAPGRGARRRQRARDGYSALALRGPRQARRRKGTRRAQTGGVSFTKPRRYWAGMAEAGGNRTHRSGGQPGAGRL